MRGNQFEERQCALLSSFLREAPHQSNLEISLNPNSFFCKRQYAVRTVHLSIFLTRKRPHQHQRPERGHKSEIRKRRQPEGNPRKEAPILSFKLGLVFATRGSTWLQIWPLESFENLFLCCAVLYLAPNG